MLENIIPSKTRRKILNLFFQNLDSAFHLRRVAREIDEEINAVKRELDILEKEGMLKKEKRVNKTIYFLNNKYLYYEEFLRIFAKQGTLVQKILKNLSKLGKIKYLALSYKFVKKQEISETEIYLLFVGIIVTPEVAKIIAEEEKNYGREINYTVMSEEEFRFRKKNNDPFIWRFLKQPKIMIIGSEEELVQ